MLGWIFSLFKWTVFAVVILVLGQVVQWRDRPISDHIKSTLSHFETPSQLAPQLARKVERFSKEEKARLDTILSKQAR